MAHTRDVAALGLDAEPDHPLQDDILAVVALPEEVELVDGLRRLMPDGPSWDRLMFCAKEATYKAWFPLTRRWLGFDQVTITLDLVTGTFLAHLLVPGPVVNGQALTGFPGRWLARNGLIIAAIAVPARRGPIGGNADDEPAAGRVP